MKKKTQPNASILANRHVSCISSMANPKLLASLVRSSLIIGSLAAPLASCMSSGAGIDDTLRTASVPKSATTGTQATTPGYGYQAMPMAIDAPKTPNQLAEARIPALYKSIRHGVCKGGFSRQPTRLDAKRMKPGDPYYMEMRMRQTPPLPIGHTYIAYGRLDGNGRKINENLIMLAPVGGYVGAGAAGAIPMPGLLTPTMLDCRLKPTATYRISLTAVQYEKLLKAVKKAKKEKPRYHLFANNCNHFASRIAASVGIRPPKNRYTAALAYIYDVIEENEGKKVARLRHK